MRQILISALAVPILSAAAFGQATTIRITDTMLVDDAERLGVHFSGDNYYDSVILKRRVAENFEGSVQRLHIMGPSRQSDPMGLSLWGSNVGELREWVDATAHVLGGPDQWKTVRVAGVEMRDRPHRHRPSQTEAAAFVKFDQPVRWTGEGYVAGVLLEKSDLSVGQHPWLEEKRKTVAGKRVRSVELNPQYCSADNTRVVTGDVADGAHGVAAMSLDAAEQEAFLRFRVQFYQAAPFDGEWTVRFRARAKRGSPALVVSPTVAGTSFEPELTGAWKQYTGTLTLDRPSDPEKNPIFILDFRVTGGEVLLDDIELWKVGDGANPTPFRDELVEVFQFLRPGSVRYLRNVRDTYLNSVLPRTRNASRRGIAKRRDDFGTHEFYQFCAHIDADPWATLPGTLLPEDIDQMMEYHGAPADVGLGRLRAELGQPEPWTRVFRRIHIQFGNEAITFGGTGYWGPDYWQALVERAKASPYYDPDRFVFHMNEQGCGTRGMDMHPAFDRFTISGYHIFGVYEDQIAAARDRAGFYDWVFASVWHMWMHPEHSKNFPNLKGARQRGMEISIYEGGNYHTTFCNPENVPLEQINRMIVGRAGGMSATHSMLVLLKHWGARTQQSFNLSQFSFRPGGAFGNIPGRVRCWGGVLRVGDPATRRYRPRFLTLRIANEVIGGGLVETVHEGADPTFDVTNRFGAGYGPSRNPKEMTVADVPRIHSYAFREGRRRGLILVSNDPRESRDVVLRFEGEPVDAEARTWLLESPDLESTNEHDWALEGPLVKIRERMIEGFADGHALSLPPATMVAIEWTVR